MKTFCVISLTNYEQMTHIVNADDAVEAEKIAIAAGAWEGCEVNEIDTKRKGCVFCSY